ncbi:MAG: ABC transporter permease [Puia sp.]|nr:ABC transporter permease [Puia sp.]
MDRERLLYLLQQFITDKATREEEKELLDRLEFPESDKTLTDFLKERWNDLPLRTLYHVTPAEDLTWDKLRTYIQAAATKHPQEPPVKPKEAPIWRRHTKKTGIIPDISNKTAMLKNYFKIAFRNIVRHKAFATINIAGLAIGMACSIFILLWVQNELSYDKFHKNADHIYRLSAGGATNSGPMVPELKAEIPAIKNFVRLLFVQPTTTVFATGTKRFEEKAVYYADSTLLQVFSFPLTDGDPETALARPDAVLITEDMAKKYFGKEDPIGKILKKDNKDNVVVTGVLKNIPANSHLQFDFIMPMSAKVCTPRERSGLA